MNDYNFGPEYDVIPQHTMNALWAWMDHGQMPGNFVQAVLKNDLQGAFAYADSNNRRALHVIVKFVFNKMPSECWGNAEKVKAWRDRQ